ncbi:MAG: hypothetical protein WHV44_12450 [Anaerolineales bacterium]
MRKEAALTFNYSWAMDIMPTAHWTVAQVLTASPQLARVFLALKTDCVGCPMDKFCKLDEVAEAYDLPLEHLLEMIRQEWTV